MGAFYVKLLLILILLKPLGYSNTITLRWEVLIMTEKYKLNPKCKNCLLLNSILSQKSEIEETLQCAVRITKLGIWSWDLITNKVYLSDEIFRITGHNKEAYDGNFEYVFNKIIHPQSRDLLQTSIEKAFESGLVPQEEYRVLNASDIPCWVRLNGEIIYDENGQRIKMIGTLLDVTEDYVIKSDLTSDLSFFSTLMEILPNPIFYKDAAGLYKFCNSAFLQYIGLKKDQIIDKSVYDISPKELADIYFKADHDLMVKKGQQVYESKVKYADGTIHDVIFSKAAHIDDLGNSVGLVGIIQDITEKKISERKDKILQSIRDIFWKMNQSIMDFENDEAFFKRILTELNVIFHDLNRASVFNLTSLEAINVITHFDYKDFKEINTDIEPLKAGVLQCMRGQHTKPKICYDFLKDTTTSEDKEKLILFNHTPNALLIPIQFNNDVKWYLAIERDQDLPFDKIDFYAAEFLQEELPIFYRIFDLTKATLKLSRFDSLTNLANRGYFNLLFDEKFQNSMQSKSVFALIVFDLDGLKHINDSYGHHSGDVYIKTFTEMLQKRLKFIDVSARLGGDEFACLVSEPDLALIEKEILSFRQDFECLNIKSDALNFMGSFSYGISIYPDDAMSTYELMKLADKRMYKDKNRI